MQTNHASSKTSSSFETQCEPSSMPTYVSSSELFSTLGEKYAQFPISNTSITSNISSIKHISSLRVIMHMDMDCFYAQVDRERFPAWVGQPIAVVQTGVLCVTSNYRIRMRGAKKIGEAKPLQTLIPNTKFSASVLSKYRAASRKWRDIVLSIGCVVQKKSIDECLIDLTPLVISRLFSMVRPHTTPSVITDHIDARRAQVQALVEASPELLEESTGTLAIAQKLSRSTDPISAIRGRKLPNSEVSRQVMNPIAMTTLSGNPLDTVNDNANVLPKFQALSNDELRALGLSEESIRDYNHISDLENQGEEGLRIVREMENSYHPLNFCRSAKGILGATAIGPDSVFSRFLADEETSLDLAILRVRRQKLLFLWSLMVIRVESLKRHLEHCPDIQGTKENTTDQMMQCEIEQEKSYLCSHKVNVEHIYEQLERNGFGKEKYDFTSVSLSVSEGLQYCLTRTDELWNHLSKILMGVGTLIQEGASHGLPWVGNVPFTTFRWNMEENVDITTSPSASSSLPPFPSDLSQHSPSYSSIFAAKDFSITPRLDFVPVILHNICFRCAGLIYTSVTYPNHSPHPFITSTSVSDSYLSGVTNAPIRNHQHKINIPSSHIRVSRLARDRDGEEADSNIVNNLEETTKKDCVIDEYELWKCTCLSPSPFSSSSSLSLSSSSDFLLKCGPLVISTFFSHFLSVESSLLFSTSQFSTSSFDLNSSTYLSSPISNKTEAKTRSHVKPLDIVLSSPFSSSPSLLSRGEPTPTSTFPSTACVESIHSMMLGIGSQLAFWIRECIHLSIGYTTSSAVAPNPMLAKMLSSQHKPNQQTVMLPAAVDDFLSTQYLSSVPGFGPTAQETAALLGWSRISQLQALSKNEIRRICLSRVVSWDREKNGEKTSKKEPEGGNLRNTNTQRDYPIDLESELVEEEIIDFTDLSSLREDDELSTLDDVFNNVEGVRVDSSSDNSDSDNENDIDTFNCQDNPKRHKTIHHHKNSSLTATSASMSGNNLVASITSIGNTSSSDALPDFISELAIFESVESAESFAAWVYNISRGIDYSTLEQASAPKSLGQSKNQRTYTHSERIQLLRWMAEKLSERIEEDHHEYGRMPQVLVLGATTFPGSIQGTSRSFSRRCPITFPKKKGAHKGFNEKNTESVNFDVDAEYRRQIEESLFTTGTLLITKHIPKTAQLTSISISVTNFTEESLPHSKGNILKMFEKKELSSAKPSFFTSSLSSAIEPKKGKSIFDLKACTGKITTTLKPTSLSPLAGIQKDVFGIGSGLSTSSTTIDLSESNSFEESSKPESILKIFNAVHNTSGLVSRYGSVEQGDTHFQSKKEDQVKQSRQSSFKGFTKSSGTKRDAVEISTTIEALPAPSVSDKIKLELPLIDALREENDDVKWQSQPAVVSYDVDLLSESDTSDGERVEKDEDIRLCDQILRNFGKNGQKETPMFPILDTLLDPAHELASTLLETRKAGKTQKSEQSNKKNKQSHKTSFIKVSTHASRSSSALTPVLTFSSYMADSNKSLSTSRVPPSSFLSISRENASASDLMKAANIIQQNIAKVDIYHQSEKDKKSENIEEQI